MNNQEECGICLDALTAAVELPCRHKFCSDCLDRWRPKFASYSGENTDNRCCPLCRERIPPSKEMITQLKFLRQIKSDMEARGGTNTSEYAFYSQRVEELERKIGDWDGKVINYSEDKEECITLPRHIYDAAKDGNIRQVLRWLGPQPVERRRLNAGESGLNMTLVHSVSMTHNNLLSLSILLQFGANVNAQSANGSTALALVNDYYPQARLLLEWGGEFRTSAMSEKRGTVTRDDLSMWLRMQGNIKLGSLIKSELGGRRCEVTNLTNHPHLNGKTCVVEKYFPEKSKYKIIFEVSGNAALVGLNNLKRRDRTPEDCGYYISFDDGKFVRRDFATKEECQAYVASLVEDANSSNAIADQSTANDVAEKLARLDVRGDGGSAKSKKKKGKGKKGGKKKK